MDYEQEKKKGKFAILSSIGEFGFGILMLMLSSSEKDSWEYYLSSSHRSEVDMVVMLGWLSIIVGVVELVYGVIVMSAAGEQQSTSGASEEKPEGTIEWIGGEIIAKEWDPNHHQVEWITMRQKNGVAVRMWHYIADNAVYNVGDQGLIRAEDRLITEFISNEHVM